MGTINLVSSLRYDMTGRKRKTNSLKQKSRSSSQVRTQGFHPCNIGSNPVRDAKQYRSMPIGSYDAQQALQDFKKKLVAQQESKNFTVAPAYNKGAYQVIPRDCVKDIGR